MREEARLMFFEGRDGVTGAIAFAKQGIRVYRKCVLQSAKRGYGVKGSPFADRPPHHSSFREYRREFIQSYVDFKRYVAKERNSILMENAQHNDRRTKGSTS